MRKVEVKANINVVPEIVIEAFTNPAMLRDWWSVDRAFIEKRTGGLYVLAWNIDDNGFGFVSTGIIKEYKQGSLLIVKDFIYLNPERPFLGPMTLEVKVKGKGSTTDLYLCQAGYQEGPDWDWYYEAVRQAWPAVVIQLKNYLEKR